MKLLLYCTKSKPYLYQGFARPMHTLDYHNPFNFKWYLLKKKTSDSLNGKIVAECDYEIEEIHCGIHYEPEVNIGVCQLPEFTCNEYYTKTLGHFELLKQSGLKDLTLPYYAHQNELDDYLKGNNGYAIHIKNLCIFDKPKELKEYYIFGGIYEDKIKKYKSIKKAPKNMRYIYECTKTGGCRFLEKKVLISIHPEQLCKILNGEKTIEVRKKVLKGKL